MKILIITHYNFAGKLGGATNRVLGIARALSRYALVKILHRGPNMRLDNLHFIGYKSFFPFSTSHPISDMTSPYVSSVFLDFFRKAKSALENVDIVQVEQPYLMVPTLILARALDRDPLIVLDAHNVDFIAVKSKINGISLNSVLTIATIPFVFLSESIAVKGADKILCVSKEDQHLFMSFYKIPRDKLVVVPNGVDLKKFEKLSPVSKHLSEDKKIVFFHGTLSWHPNLEAAIFIVDYIAPRVPEAIFLIAGVNPSSKLIRKANKVRNVKILGYVKNLETWIKLSSVCIAPILRGGGTRLKILEYAAAGKPIVATFKAVEGLGMINSVHGFFCNDIDENFIRGIRLLLEDKQLACKLGENAKALAKKFDWHVIGEKLYRIYEKILEGRSSQ